MMSIRPSVNNHFALAQPLKIIALGFGLLSLATSALAAPPAHVVVVLFENASIGDVNGLPFFHQLAQQGAALTNFHAETHPSQPNYIALIAGDTFGVKDDSDVSVSTRHIGDLLEAKGKTWKVYAEGYPGGCFTGARGGTYARKHEPFISFKNIQTNPQRCGRIVDAGNLDADITAGTLPSFALYIPDMNNDGHDTGVAYADKWFSGRFGPLLKDPRFTQGTLLIATFDEGDLTDPANHIFTVLVGEGIAPGSQSAVRYDHFSLLRTFESLLGLDSLGQKDASATAIMDVWKR